ncbi:unnamed protein product [Prorocentrum cordatum]|uniref:Uncharacterized protein n=1 Tax=Prorocentrum cordatum TaxID=2364126 RepID=A0ABN9T419_9DINO|nr:unnamed protein product [Polarella glacialis]
MLIRNPSVAIWFSIFLERHCLIAPAQSRTVGGSSSMALEGARARLTPPTDAEMTAAPPLRKKGRDDDDNGGGGKSLREMAKTMGRLVLADSREIQATGKLHNAQSTVLREKVKAGEQVDFESRAPPRAAAFAASAKRRDTGGNLSKQELTDGFANMWKDVLMTFSPQQIAALLPHFRWKAHKGKPTNGNKDKGKGKGLVMHAVEVTRAHGPKLAALLGEAMLDMKAAYKAGAAPPGPLHRQLSKMINDM